MCLLIDDREDASIRRALAGYDVDLSVCRLEFGDVCWEGYGPGDRPVMIGVERKRLPDLVTAMTDHRLSGHQLAGMRQSYDVLYLLIEEYWRPSANGGVELRRGGQWRPMFSHEGGVSFRQLDAFLQSLGAILGVTVLRSGTTAETAAVYASRYHWWRKKWSEHHTHEMIWSRDPRDPIPGGRGRFEFREPGLVERAAALLPGIDRLAWEVGRRFHTVIEMAEADERDWQEIPGIGETRAHAAWQAFRTPAKARTQTAVRVSGS